MYLTLVQVLLPLKSKLIFFHMDIKHLLLSSSIKKIRPSERNAVFETIG